MSAVSTLDVVDAAIFQTINGEAVIDAEQYTRLGGTVGGTWFVNTEKTGYGGSGYLEAAKDDPGTLTFSGNTIRAEYDIDFKTAGTYYVHLRSYAEDATQNGFFATVNGVQVSYGNPAASYVYARYMNRWWWYTDGGGAGARGYMVSFSVPSPGKRTFAVVRRDKGARLDQIWLTQNQSTPVDASGINRPAPSNFIVNESVDSDNDGFTVAQGDCDDANASINPGATEICGDGIDQDCSGADLACDGADVDDDGDGYTENEGDCDDANASVHPGATEICGDGIDQDCSGADLLCGGDAQEFGFDAGSQGFAYLDDLFRGTRRPDYASGVYESSGGYAGGGLRVTLGGLDFTNISDGMSGGWTIPFTVNEAGVVTIDLKYRLILAGEYESDEYSQILASVDGTLIGTGGNDYLIELRETDVNGPAQDSGWRVVTLQMTLSQGTHTLAVGAWNNKKTGALEVTNAYFDDIVISQSSSSPDADGDGYTVAEGDCDDANASVHPGAVEVCDDNIDNDCDGRIDCLDDSCDAFCGGIREEFGFDANSEGFVYNDDLFRGTGQPAYASGSYVATDGYSGGGLLVTLGNTDSSWVTNGMSGGWSISFDALSAGQVSISLRYRLIIAGEYESDEYSQVLASVDGALVGAGGNDYLFELRGTDENTPLQDSGWQTATLQLTLNQGLHTLTVGAWNNKKTGALEVTRAYFDDIVISHSDSSTLLLFENFSNGDLSQWNVVDESIARPSDWLIVNGKYTQLSSRVDEWSQNYHLGSYAYYKQGFGFSDYNVKLKMTSLASAFGARDSMGIIFRYQDPNNYYRYLISRMQGIRRLEKKTNGVFTTLAFDGRGFNVGQEMLITVVVDGTEMIVYENGEILFSAKDTDHEAGTIALFTQGPTAFDDIEVSLPTSFPRLAISYPGAYTIASTDDVAGPYEMEGAATAMNLLSGYGVKFIKDAGMTGEEACLDYSPPYDTAGCAFSGILSGDHSLSAMIVDGAGQTISDSTGLDGDANGKIGFGGKYVAVFGDSISNGFGDDDTSDNNSLDGRNLSRGLSPLLNDLLSGTFDVPVTVYNEGLGGTTSKQGLSRIVPTIDVHPFTQLWLVLLGTNDSSGALPLMSGVGCTATDFASGNIECVDTYKHYMSRIVDRIQAAGHTPFLAKVPFIKDAPLARDLLIQEYNQCIQELTSEKGLPGPPPDFYTAFKQNQGLFFDEVHPNGNGYQEMATMWHDAIVASRILNRP